MTEEVKVVNRRIERFEKNVEDFNKIDVEEAKELLLAQEGNIIFIANEECPYCARFSPKLEKVAKENDLTIHYLYSEIKNYKGDMEDFRNSYGVKTIPALLYSDKDNLRMKSDSSMKKDEILDFITPDSEE